MRHTRRARAGFIAATSRCSIRFHPTWYQKQQMAPLANGNPFWCTLIDSTAVQFWRDVCDIINNDPYPLGISGGSGRHCRGTRRDLAHMQRLHEHIQRRDGGEQLLRTTHSRMGGQRGARDRRHAASLGDSPTIPTRPASRHDLSGAVPDGALGTHQRTQLGQHGRDWLVGLGVVERDGAGMVRSEQHEGAYQTST